MDGFKPTVDELAAMIRADGRLQFAPAEFWDGSPAAVVVRVRPSKDPAPYWQAFVDNEVQGVIEADLIRYVAVKLQDVAVHGFPPPGFAEMPDGWWVTSMSAHGEVVDFVPDGWR